jgi:hypothetical protein
MKQRLCIFTLGFLFAQIIVLTTDAFSQATKFRSGIFLHHSTGGCIWGPNGSSTSVPQEITLYNMQHGYTDTNAVSMNEEGWPLNPWSNEWERWHRIFDDEDPMADIHSYLAANRIIVIKSCFPSSSMADEGSASDTLDPTLKSAYNYKWHWRNIVNVMRQHQDNFFVIWTNAPLVASQTNDQEAQLSDKFCRWAKDTLAVGTDPAFGAFPSNVYVFDFFHKLANSSGKLPLQYAASGSDSHPNGTATQLVAPQFVREIFDAAIAYEQSDIPPLSAPELFIPPDGAVNQSRLPILKWHKTSHAETFHLQVSNDSAFNSTIYDDSTLTDTVQSIGVLAGDTTFYWRVRAKNITCIGDWSEVWKFATAPVGGLEFSVSNRWNLVSLPLKVDDQRKTILFPTATSDAYIYEPHSSYFLQDTLKNGTGYWLKFGYDQLVPLSGSIITVDTIYVELGWNLIGSISEPLAASSITSDPAGIFTSKFFGYSYGYVASDTIFPMKGYWVKVNQGGLLILSSLSTSTASQRIKIVPTTELPPSPPENITSRISEVPENFALNQNYPNPFNPLTIINYQLPISSHVVLKIFDLLGREITTLVEENQEAGSYDVKFGRSALPSGMYFYRIEMSSVSDPSKTFTQIRKMILLQ